MSWESVSFALMGIGVLTMLCPALVVIPVLLLLRGRLQRVVRPRRYWIGLGVQASSVAGFAAMLLALKIFAGEAGSAASFMALISAPVWWVLCLTGLVIGLTGARPDARDSGDAAA
ncbi:hypothetical protein LDO32_09045 [Luteimonas sp. Y-2-2-4F]|nr:hypothetical protein [Luteimonas sp. Y-2-2-4F]MCD9031561.1 hypothetical protein [Luteimonas sp. Y-2-2-4F]MCD9031864.1 hypothetical protein [Luteimonas sp. Y-2-2-4F]